jgi:hypothetical protein
VQRPRRERGNYFDDRTMLHRALSRANVSSMQCQQHNVRFHQVRKVLRRETSCPRPCTRREAGRVLGFATISLMSLRSGGRGTSRPLGDLCFCPAVRLIFAFTGRSNDGECARTLNSTGQNLKRRSESPCRWASDHFRKSLPSAAQRKAKLSPRRPQPNPPRSHKGQPMNDEQTTAGDV